MTLKAPFSYFGGKSRIADQIVAALPPHRGYVEPFAGSCAVLFAKPRARIETVNDLDRELVTFWRVLRDRSDELIRACALTPHSRDEYEASKDRPVDLDELEIARRVWVKLSQGRTGTLKKTGWKHYVDPHGSSISMASYLEAYVDRMAVVAERLAGVGLEARPALELIAAYGQHADNCLYVDPPYLGTTRSGTNYAHEMHQPGDHVALAEALHECKSSVVLSGYDSPLYEELYAGWHVTRIDTFSGQGNTHSGRTEVLWSNRVPEPTLFSDHGATP